MYHDTSAGGLAVTLHSKVPFFSMTMVILLGGGSAVHSGGTKRGKHIRELRYGSCVLIKVHFLLKMLLGLKNAGAQGFWIFDILGTCENSMWYRLDYQPQFGKGARAPPRKHSGRVDQTRESEGNGAYMW